MTLLGSYLTTYIGADVLCILIAVILLYKIDSNLGKQNEIRAFKLFATFYVLFAFSDIFWIIVGNNFVHYGRIIDDIIVYINMFSVCIMAYFWFLYNEFRILPSLSKGRFKYYALIPLIIVFLTYVTQVGTDNIFYFDDEGLQIGQYYFVPTIVNSFYMLGPFFHSLFVAIRTRTAASKRLCRMVFIFVLPPIIASVVDVYIHNTNVVGMAVLYSMVMVFMLTQESMVFVDPLTGLNNRRRIGMFIDSQLEQTSEQNPSFLALIDLNKFKDINDTYGHDEGDHALCIIADAMKFAASKYGYFAARFGGDEFVLAGSIAPMDADSYAEHFKKVFESISFYTKSVELPYELTFSAGYKVTTDRKTNLESLMKEADRMLYENKHYSR